MENDEQTAVPVKRCNSCGELRELGWFGYSGRSKDNLASTCSYCVSNKRREDRVKRRVRMNKELDDW